jgi:ABC-type multidrug transport system ATPase subunit
VLLSSHLLHEIEVIADDLVVIGSGRIVAQGAKSDLLASAGVVVRAPPNLTSWLLPSAPAGSRRRTSGPTAC